MRPHKTPEEIGVEAVELMRQALTANQELLTTEVLQRGELVVHVQRLAEQQNSVIRILLGELDEADPPRADSPTLGGHAHIHAADGVDPLTPEAIGAVSADQLGDPVRPAAPVDTSALEESLAAIQSQVGRIAAEIAAHKGQKAGQAHK